MFSVRKLTFLAIRWSAGRSRKFTTRSQTPACPTLPLIWSEFNASFKTEPEVTDSIYMGPWLADTIHQCDGLVDIMSYWTFSDVFEEQGVVKTPFYGGYGLIAEDGIPKPAFNAFRLLHQARRSAHSTRFRFRAAHAQAGWNVSAGALELRFARANRFPKSSSRYSSKAQMRGKPSSPAWTAITEIFTPPMKRWALRVIRPRPRSRHCVRLQNFRLRNPSQ